MINIKNTYLMLYALVVYFGVTNQLAQALDARDQTVDYEYIGPMPCQGNEQISGYSNLNKLNQDMFVNAVDVYAKNKTSESEYVYVLCPNTIFDIDKESKRSGLHETIGIFLNNTVLRCGTDEKTFGTCIVQGGDVQIVFPPELEVKHAVIQGITFTGTRGYGVAAYSHPSSDASFINCTWIENDAIYAIVIYYDPNYLKNQGNIRRNLLDIKDSEESLILNSRRGFSDFITSISAPQVERQLKIGYPAMEAQFTRCVFSDNVLSGEVINNQGGTLRIVETTFINNVVDYAVIGVAYGGKLSMEGNTHFQENVSPFVPIFVDNDSFLNLNVDNTGKDNVGIACEDGIFLEKENSYCMEGGKCEGDCCKFGDDSCDRFGSIQGEMKPSNPTNDIDGAESSTQSGEDEYKISTMKAPETATATYKDQSKTVTSLTATIVILIVALVIVLGLLIFKKKREHAFLGTTPDTPDIV